MLDKTKMSLCFYKGTFFIATFLYFVFGAAPPFGRVGLCQGSLFARPCGGFAALVWPFGPPLSIPQPAAAKPPVGPINKTHPLTLPLGTTKIKRL